MAIDAAAIAKIARLSRIRVKEEERAALAQELGNILDFIAMLDEVDVAKVAPMASPVEMTLKLREDKITDGGYSDKVLANAPESSHGFFVVPKVVE